MLLPLSITMTELNGNEKFARLRRPIPAHPSTAGSKRIGDLMLYGSDTLVLFYKSFSTTYNYTKIGQVDDAAGFASVLFGTAAPTRRWDNQRQVLSHR